MPWVGDEKEVLTAWIAARARNLVRLTPASARVDVPQSKSIILLYPSAARPQLRLTITVNMQPVGEVLLSDVTELDLENIGELLGVRRLTAFVGGELPRRVEGRLHGASRRVFVPLVVSTPNRTVELNVLFLVDTGAPSTHLRKDTLTALFNKDLSIGQSAGDYFLLRAPSCPQRFFSSRIGFHSGGPHSRRGGRCAPVQGPL